MDVGHTRAWARRRRSGPISTICRRRWQHDNATGAVALLQSGCALPARGHGPGETYLSTGGKATYRDRNAVAGNRATSAGPPTRCFGPQVLSTSKEVLTLATITGTSSNNLLNGTSSADTINGLGGNDTINGGAGNDAINGGTGLDVMTGGAGADSFVFVSGDAINTEPHDRITDFQVGVDRLVLPGAILSTEDQASGFYVHYANNN